MDNYSYNNSYPDSRDSTPRSSSREIDCENASWADEPPQNYKVKFMCSYGGKILPRSHDNQLAYVGGDTKILAVDRSIRFTAMISKLSAISDLEVCFKYQLPGEDLDALISVTNEEDLEHMMIEYDRLLRASPKPARLRLFLFPVNPPSGDSPTSEEERKPNQQWFVDALNSVPAGALEIPTSAPNPDFLFGLEKSGHQSPMKHELRNESPVAETVAVKIQIPQAYVGGGEPTVSQAEIQRQIQELQRLQIANHEQAMFQRKNDEMLARAFPGDYYVPQQKVENKHTGMPVSVPGIPAPATMTVPSVPTPYWQERSGGYQVAHTGPVSDQPVYLVPGPAPGMFHHQQQQQQLQHQHQQQQQQQQQPGPRQMTTGLPGQQQGYYGVQRMVQPPPQQQQQENQFYREQPVYGHNMGPPPPPQQQQLQHNIVRTTPPPPQMGAVVGESGYATQMAYDSMGRQMFYTGGAHGGSGGSGGGLVAPPPPVTSAAGSYLNQHHQQQQGNVVTVDGRQPQVLQPQVLPAAALQQQQQVAAVVEGSKVMMKSPSQASQASV